MTAKKYGAGLGLALFTTFAICNAATAGPIKVANATKDGKSVCPITKESFTVTAASEKSTYKGKTYAFCCAGCKPQFDKNPAKYVQTATPKKAAPKSAPAGGGVKS